MLPPTDLLSLARHLMPLTPYPYRGKAVGCPICDSAETRPVARLDRRWKLLPTVMCAGCGVLYTNPMPTDADLAGYYSRMYRLDYQLAPSGPRRRHVLKRRQASQKRVSMISPYLSRGARSLDFGAGSGEFVTAMLAAGFDAYGFDPSEGYGSYARQQLGTRIRVSPWQAVDHGPDFDIVTSFHVLEHLQQPLEALARMRSWLRPGGKVLVEVPNMGPAKQRRGFGAFHFAHVLGFNHFNLLYAAARIGLKPVEGWDGTRILFEKAEPHESREYAEQGVALAGQAFSAPVKSYFTYHWRKLKRRAVAASIPLIGWDAVPSIGI